ncbi:MAG: ATP-dependent zinc protease [Myxococcota bacterium]
MTGRASKPRRTAQDPGEPDGPVIIGWSEQVDLPDWHIRGLRAKVDTGARSSALHVEGLKLLPRRRLEYHVVLHRHDRDRRIRVVAPIARRSRVRSSTGEYTQRYFVRTRLRLAGLEREVEISLVDRGDMMFRMLVGRSALADHFLVDPRHRNLGRAALLRARRATHRSRPR